MVYIIKYTKENKILCTLERYVWNIISIKNTIKTIMIITVIKSDLKLLMLKWLLENSNKLSCNSTLNLVTQK